MAKMHKQDKNPALDKIVYLAAFLYPVTALPQVIKIFSTQSATDLSLASWIMYCAFELIFVIYGIKNKLKPIAIQSILWLLIYALIILGIILYG